MAGYLPVGGSGGGAGFQLFVQKDNQDGIYADAAARDAYFGANPDELAILDANEFLIIKLLDNGSGEVAYQQRSGAVWRDVTSLIQGEKGEKGDDGTGAPGGPDTAVQYNTAGAFDGNADFTWNNGTKTVTVNGDVIADNITDIYSADGELSSNRFVTGNNNVEFDLRLYDTDVGTWEDYAELNMSAFSVAIYHATRDAGGGNFQRQGLNLLGPNGIFVEDDQGGKGLVYNADYSSGWGDRSIPDKGYVDAGDNRNIYDEDNNLQSARTVTGLNGVGITFDTYNDTGTGNWTSRGTVKTDSNETKIQWREGDGGGSTSGNAEILLNASGIQITDTDQLKGAFYAADYSANFTDRSIVDKAYIDTQDQNTLYLSDGDIAEDRVVDVLGTNQLEFRATENYVTLNDTLLTVGSETEGGVTGLQFGADLTTVYVDNVNQEGIVYDGDYTSSFVDRSLVDKDYADNKSGAAVSAKLNQTTGLIEGGVTTQASATTIEITSGRGLVHDSTDAMNILLTEVTWSPLSPFSPINLAVPGTWLIGYDVNGVYVEFSVSALASMLRHHYILIGAYITDGININRVTSEPLNLGYNAGQSFMDFVTDVIGPANVTGNIYAPNGANLNIDLSGGVIYIPGANFRSDQDIPDEVSVPASSPLTFFRAYQAPDPLDEIIFTLPATQLIDPNNWDDGSGTLASMPSNDWQVQALYISPEPDYIVAYGQEIFNTKVAATNALQNGTLSFTEKNGLRQFVLRGYLVLQQGSTDLSNTTEAEFFEATKFRISGESLATGSSGVTLPGGLDGNVQFNDSGLFGGSANLNWATSTDTLEIAGRLEVSGSYVLSQDVPDDNLLFSSRTSIPVGTAKTTSFGGRALNTLGLGQNNTAFGALALFDLTDGNDNTAIGYNSLANLTTGSENVAVGNGTMEAASTASNCTAVGYQAAHLDSLSGDNNTCIGHESGAFLTSGQLNLFLGSASGQNCDTGNNNIVLGSHNLPNPNTFNHANIGNFLFAEVVSQWARVGGSGEVTKELTLNVDGSFGRTVQRTAITSNYPADTARLAVTDTAAPRTITILSLDIAVVDKEFEIKDESGGAGANNITVVTQGAQTIDGAVSVTITVNYGILRLYSDGSNLFTR